MAVRLGSVILQNHVLDMVSPGSGGTRPQCKLLHRYLNQPIFARFIFLKSNLIGHKEVLN